ncbi:hypothetical protein CK203_108975 [Vitis vinifera]|uniref:Uncharacterized protein n=1 Tax=Vitis vinifera TaxID=29760 RepID=A0A438BQ23_VITVI|nr:hypothetical protein CK203_108975 [Vitis vinifera]
MRSSMNVGKGIWRPSMLVLHHGFDTWLLLVSEVTRGWDEPNSKELGRMKAPVNPKGGMYMLSEDMDMKAKVANIARSWKNLS